MVNSHLRVSRKGRFNIFPNTRAKIIFYVAISTAYLLVVFVWNRFYGKRYVLEMYKGII